MRLLLVLTRFYPAWGGTENQAKLQATQFAKRGHSVEVVTWRHLADLPADLPKVEMRDGIVIRRVAYKSGKPWSAVRAFAAMSIMLLRRARRSDVIIAHQVNLPAVMACGAAWLVRRPMAAKMATSPHLKGSELNQAATRGILGLTRRIAVRFIAAHCIAIATTQEIEHGLKSAGFRRIVRIPNAVADPGIRDLKANREAMLGPLGIAPSSKVVMVLGRLDPIKRVDHVVTAWSYRSREFHDAVLVIVGRGPEEQRLKAQVTERGLTESVYFVSSTTRSHEFIASADVVVIASKYEGMSNVLLEAMAAGVPVVSTPVSGSVDLIRDRYSGRIVPHSDPSQLMEAIQEVLGSPGDMGSRAREAVLAQCSVERVVCQYERLCDNACSLREGVITAEELETYAR
jgi:glycosyltransferase involved in cell wall biosynthesis